MSVHKLCMLAVAKTRINPFCKLFQIASLNAQKREITITLPATMAVTPAVKVRANALSSIWTELVNYKQLRLVITRI